jgi:hypothetical protein
MPGVLVVPHVAPMLGMIDMPRMMSLVVPRVVVAAMSIVRAMIPAGAWVVSVVMHRTLS